MFDDCSRYWGDAHCLTSQRSALDFQSIEADDLASWARARFPQLVALFHSPRVPFDLIRMTPVDIIAICLTSFRDDFTIRVALVGFDPPAAFPEFTRSLKHYFSITRGLWIFCSAVVLEWIADSIGGPLCKESFHFHFYIYSSQDFLDHPGGLDSRNMGIHLHQMMCRKVDNVEEVRNRPQSTTDIFAICFKFDWCV